jgi:hypothetical protein
MASPIEGCVRSGDSDFYGLGVRISIYLQFVPSLMYFLRGYFPVEFLETLMLTTFATVVAISVALANKVLDDVGFLAASYVFQIQLFTVLIAVIALLLQIMKGTLDPVLRQPLKTLIRRFFWLVGVVVLHLWLMAILMWFWAVGYRSMQAPSCHTQAWFFVTVPAYTWFRTLSLVLIALSAVFEICLVICSVRYVISRRREDPSASNNASSDDGKELARQVTDLVLQSFSTCFRPSVVLWIAALVAGAIAGVETTLKSNNVTGVYNMDTGQLMALMIGVTSVVSSLIPVPDLPASGIGGQDVAEAEGGAAVKRGLVGLLADAVGTPAIKVSA